MTQEEWFDVVDARDVVIGCAPRQRVHAEGLRHRAAHVLVVDAGERVYVQQRAWSKDCSPGCWDTSAAGHLNPGEDYADAALRELGEELGVSPDGPLTPLFKLEATPDTGQEFVWVYRAQVSAPLAPDPGEIIDGRWCTPAVLTAWISRSPDDFTPTFRRIWAALTPETVPPLTVEEAHAFAHEWVEAWNAHDLERVLAHYEDDFVMSSPLIVTLAGEPSGRLRGKAAVGAYWAAALERLPDLHFELSAVLVGVRSLTLHYLSPRGPAAEVFHFAPGGKVREAAAHYQPAEP